MHFPGFYLLLGCIVVLQSGVILMFTFARTRCPDAVLPEWKRSGAFCAPQQSSEGNFSTQQEQSNKLGGCDGVECFCPGPQRPGRKPICIWPALPRNGSLNATVSKPSSKAWHGDDQAVFREFFQNPPKTDGMYMEMGAFDGETMSNTLFFEDLGWSGVLVEAHPARFKKLKTRRPHAIRIEMASCEDPLGEIEFLGNPELLGNDGVVDVMPDKFRKAFHGVRSFRYNVSCAPIVPFLKYAGVRQLDFFSLDVENAELVTLLSYDMRIPIHVLLIEVNDLNPSRNDYIHALLAYHGFTYVRLVGNMNELWVNPKYQDLLSVRDAFERGGQRVHPPRPLHPPPLQR